MLDRRKEVYEAIDGEREYQEEVIIPQRGQPNKTIGEFILLLGEYADRARARYAAGVRGPNPLHDVRKIAAIAVACMEKHGALKR